MSNNSPLESGLSGDSRPDYGRELKRLLGEKPDSIKRRLGGVFDSIAGDAKNRIVLCGAGSLGLRTLAGLRRAGIEPLAFLDNSAKLWHTRVEGVTVLPPQDAVAAFRESAVFVVTVFHVAVLERQLRDLGCPCVATYASLFWKYSELFLPYGGLGAVDETCESAAAILDIADAWEDNLSRQYYTSQLYWRLTLDSANLPRPCPEHDMYFPDDVVRPCPDEVIADCGAFDGDSIRALLARRGNAFKRVVAFEPDPVNFAGLARYVESIPTGLRERLSPRAAAVASHNGVLTFDVRGDMASMASASGDVSVRCARIDDAMADCPPTLIKMDVEGAELDALEGARGLIAAHRPVLAISAYHKYDDIWRIPAVIRSLEPRYKLFYRVYLDDCWETVCYAVPEDRLVLRSETTRLP